MSRATRSLKSDLIGETWKDALQYELSTAEDVITVTQNIEAALARDVPDVARDIRTEDPNAGRNTLRCVDDAVSARWLKTEASPEGRGFIAGLVLRNIAKRAVGICQRVLDRRRNGRDHGTCTQPWSRAAGPGIPTET